MVIVQIDRVNEDVDECSALIEIVHRHFANEIKKGIYLRLGQTDFLVTLNLLSEGTLNQRLYEIDLEENEMLETIIPRLAAERGIDEDLKARDMLRWVAEMNNIKASAEEIVSREVIFV